MTDWDDPAAVFGPRSRNGDSVPFVMATPVLQMTQAFLWSLAAASLVGAFRTHRFQASFSQNQIPALKETLLRLSFIST